MTKERQIYHNEIAYKHFNKAMKELSESGYIDCKRLRTCQAWVYETENYFILKSYETFIACMEKYGNNSMYDVLRTEYGYTSTSSQHIAKFRRDYGTGKWGCEFVFVAR